MSKETTSSEDAIVSALAIEREIDQVTSLPKEEARKHGKEIRSKMELWMETLGDKKVSKEYEEGFGGVAVEHSKAELLSLIKKTYPKIADQLGWNPEMEKSLTQLEEGEYEQAA